MKTTEIIKNFNQGLQQISFNDKLTMAPQIQKIHKDFLNFLYSLGDIKLLTENEIKINQNALRKVSDKTGFIQFCETSNGIYYKCCIWAQNNLELEKLTNKDNLICEKHHIECNYMKKYSMSEKIKDLINAKYNLVTLTYPLHILMHTIRYIEYNYQEDLIFLTFIKPYKSLPENRNHLNQITLADSLFEQLAQNPEYFQTNQTIKKIKSSAGKKGGIQNALNILNPIIHDYLKNDMHWINKNTNLTLTFKPNHFSILRELVIELNKNLPSDRFPQNWQEDNSFLSICCTDMKNYLLGTPIIDKPRSDINNTKYYYSSYYKNVWYLIEANENDYRLNNLQYIENMPKLPYLSKQPAIVKDLLCENNTFWSNTKYQIGCDGVFVYAGAFVNLFDLVYKLLSLLPEEKRPKKFDQFNTDSKIKSRIVRELTNLIVNKNPKIKTFYGWVYNLI